MARGKAEAIEELHQGKMLTVTPAEVPGYAGDGYTELVAAMEKMEVFDFPISPN